MFSLEPLVTAIWLKPMWCSAFCSKQRVEPMNLWLLVLVFYHRGLETRRCAVVKLNFSNPSLVLFDILYEDDFWHPNVLGREEKQ